MRNYDVIDCNGAFMAKIVSGSMIVAARIFNAHFSQLSTSWQATTHVLMAQIDGEFKSTLQRHTYECSFIGSRAILDDWLLFVLAAAA